jgi:hypothetical protein
MRHLGFMALTVFGGVDAAYAADRPAFDIPRQFDCVGRNRSNEHVEVKVTLSGDERKTLFSLVPLNGSVWPKRPLDINGIGASYYEGEGNRLWYWVGVGLNLDNAEYGFGFDIDLKAANAGSALRFSRAKYAPDLKSGRVRFDPKGAYLDDVPCSPSRSAT